MSSISPYRNIQAVKTSLSLTALKDERWYCSFPGCKYNVAKTHNRVNTRALHISSHIAMGHSRPNEFPGRENCGLCGYNSKGCTLFQSGNKVNVRCFGGEQPRRKSKLGNLKNHPKKCQLCGKQYGLLSEQEHYKNKHSDLEAPKQDDKLAEEFVDIYIEHKNKRYCKSKSSIRYDVKLLLLVPKRTKGEETY